jgi:hypothetical protein
MRSWIIAILGAIVIGGGLCFHVWRIWDMNAKCINRGGELVRGAFDFVCVESR